MARDDFTETNVNEHIASVGAATADLNKFKTKCNELIVAIENLSNTYDRVLDNKTHAAKLVLTLNTGITEDLSFRNSSSIEKFREIFIQECAARLLNLRLQLKNLTEAFNKTL